LIIWQCNAKRARDNHALAYNFAKYSPINSFIAAARITEALTEAAVATTFTDADFLRRSYRFGVMNKNEEKTTFICPPTLYL